MNNNDYYNYYQHYYYCYYCYYYVPLTPAAACRSGHAPLPLPDHRGAGLLHGLYTYYYCYYYYY